MANLGIKKDFMPLWEPSSTSSTANVSHFIDHVNQKHSLQLETYDDLHGWSTAPRTSSLFWQEAYAWLDLAYPGSQCDSPMFDSTAQSDLAMFPPPRFFPAATLNVAEIMFRDRRESDAAIHFVREGVAGIECVTWGDLRQRTQRLQSAMVHSGVQSGDVVAAVISNSVTAVALALAALSIGAIWSSASCDLGASAIVDRYSQVKPKMVFADDGFVYAGKTTDLAKRIAEWSNALGEKNSHLVDVVIIPYCDTSPDLSQLYRACDLDTFLSRARNGPLDFKPMAFGHPAFILYSSGTTGTPKCIVHSTGGAVLKIKCDMTLQHDVRRTDVVFQYTTTSWVMWVLNFVNLSCASSMLLFDGSPFHPSPTILLELAQKLRVNVFGTSPRYLQEIKNRDIVPRKSFDLSSLRTMTSTGSVLSAELYKWFYSTAFPPEALLISMSGGTDIAGCFVGGTPLLPIYAGEIQCKALGMAVDIFDAASSKPVSIERSGAAGELVCTKPFPSQPIAFLGASGHEKYRGAYFDRFGPKVWCQGDFIQRLPNTGGLVMLGRSDGVLNPSGVRFGSAEIYAVTETIPELDDSICVGQHRPTDLTERVLLFVRMKTGLTFTTELDKRIRDAIRNTHTPRHVPYAIFQVSDIPYTVNGKKCEINVKNIVNGLQMAVGGTVANPRVLEEYKKYKDLPGDDRRGKTGVSKL